MQMASPFDFLLYPLPPCILYKQTSLPYRLFTPSCASGCLTIIHLGPRLRQAIRGSWGWQSWRICGWGWRQGRLGASNLTGGPFLGHRSSNRFDHDQLWEVWSNASLLFPLLLSILFVWQSVVYPHYLISILLTHGWTRLGRRWKPTISISVPWSCKERRRMRRLLRRWCKLTR